MSKAYTTNSNKATSKKEKTENSFTKDTATIQRNPHDRENPYVMISRNLIDDMTISAECTRMLVYLLAKPNDWKINVKTLQKQLSKSGIGQKKIYIIINEAIDAGYMKREQIKRGVYTTSYKYYLSESPIFKKCSPRGKKRKASKCHALLSNKEQTNKLFSSKEVVKKRSSIPKVVQKTSPPSSATTSTIENKKKINLRRNLTEEEIQTRKLKYPPALVEEKAANVRKTMEKYKNAYVSKGPDVALDEMLVEAMRKNAKTFSTRVKQMDLSPDKTEQYQEAGYKIAKMFKEENPDLKDDIRIYSYKIEIRDPRNKQLFTDIYLPEPFIKHKLQIWANEFRESR